MVGACCGVLMSVFGYDIGGSLLASTLATMNIDIVGAGLDTTLDTTLDSNGTSKNPGHL